MEELVNARTRLAEVEVVAMDTLVELERNRSTLLHTRANVVATDTVLTRARRAVSTMTRRQARQTLFWVALIIILVGLLVLIVYFMY